MASKLSLQSAKYPYLYRETQPNLVHGLTPKRLKRILDNADQGNILEQHQLFNDMEDRCEHLAAEMGKRKRALLTLDWEVVSAKPGLAEADAAAQAVREMLDALPSFEDLLLDMADAVGHGFAALELEWEYSHGWHLPSFHFRPQTWFKVNIADRHELRLRDHTGQGAELQALGWIVHKHKSRAGWLARHGLFRAVAWAYLIRSYALEANINFIQIHGLPFRLGKYPPGTSEQDKQALYAALQSLGRDAAGIIPQGMEILFEAPNSASQDLAGNLVERCERGMSKAILGGTLTSQADGLTSTNALGQVHESVRYDLLISDALQIASTLSKQLLAPLAWLNLGISDPKLLPWFRFDTKKPEDIEVFARALPALQPIMKISQRWVHEKLKIPMAETEDDVLGAWGSQNNQNGQSSQNGQNGQSNQNGQNSQNGQSNQNGQNSQNNQRPSVLGESRLQTAASNQGLSHVAD